ncbi:MAG TPA: helix-turn-helix domain-containing GNAT family N-acetyltransferase [Mucilaginibacter sp.]|nr:helix-turn-helix domain-containing GNAT family N-acetyltransferase [Mucilaginibacter sp.]
MDFYNKVGKMAIGSRLRGLSDMITTDAAQLYHIYGVDIQPRWWPVFYVLTQTNENSITVIAREIGQSHASVSQVVREMVKGGFVNERKNKHDQRKNFVSLTEKGKAAAMKLNDQHKDVSSAINQAFSESQYDLWKAIEEWEYLLEQKSLLRRVQEEKKKREGGKVEIIDYTPEHKQAFKQLNEEWITQYFRMEESDHKALDHPDEYIIDKGGHIFMAVYEGDVVGACAIIKMDDKKFELAKMAVSPKAQGKSVGTLLGRACINKAKELGADTVYLESNTMLKPAINLYHKLGFEKITGPPSPYERSNIQMELKIRD